ncbi:hypothetical protein BH23ACT3_BH23ACT3_00530 [soil metagenome]
MHLGAKLAPLRDQGVLILGSGNVVHNLGRIAWDRPPERSTGAQRFDDAALEQLRDTSGDVLSLRDHSDFGLAAPTPDHFITMLYLAGLAARCGESPEPFAVGPAFGSITMTSYTIGDVSIAGLDTGSTDSSGSIPSDTPPEQTNVSPNDGSVDD